MHHLKPFLIASHLNFEDCPFLMQLAPCFTAALERSQLHSYIIIYS